MDTTSFQQVLAALMATHKLTQADLARTMGCNQSTVCRMVSGGIAPNLKNIYQIVMLCRAFPLEAMAILATLHGDLYTIAWLALTRAIPTEVVSMPPMPTGGQASQDDRLAKWTEWLYTLPPTEQHEILELLTLFAKRCSTPPPQ